MDDSTFLCEHTLAKESMDQALVNRITRFRTGNERLVQQLLYEQQTILRLQGKIEQLEKDKTLLVKAVGLIDRCIQVLSANGLGTIESVTTAGLRLVFDDPSLGLIIEKKEGVRGISYGLLVRGKDPSGHEVIGPPSETFGGGVSNVASFLLRVLLIKRFKLAKFLAVDESFNNVNGAQNKRNVSELLHKLCSDHGFTIFLVTGEELLTSAADHAYEVSVEDGVPVLKDLRDSTQSQVAGRNQPQYSGDDPSLPSSVAQEKPAALPD
jgi:DNA repair exonuclease SbcCD ATPase subunit